MKLVLVKNAAYRIKDARYRRIKNFSEKYDEAKNDEAKIAARYMFNEELARIANELEPAFKFDDVFVHNLDHKP